MRSHFALFIEIATGVAVIMSLVVLMIEVDDNTRAIRYQIESDRINRIRNAADSAYIPKIVEKIKVVDSQYVEHATAALIDHYHLTFEEADRFSRHLGNVWEGLQADYRYGLGDVQYVRELLSYPDQKLFWRVSESRFDPCFARWVDVIRDGKTPPPPPRSDLLSKLERLATGEAVDARIGCSMNSF